MTRFQPIAVCALVLLAPLAAGEEQRIECPGEIPQASVKLTSTPPGWQTYVAAPLFLHNAAPTSGPPQDLGQMIGDTVRKSKTEWIDKYSLEGRYPNGKWLQCDYGVLNEISLSKRLDDDTKECTISGKKGEKAGQNLFTIRCR